ncbi:MAG: cupin domain-containing protein [Xanthobacteraceae bacterium]
MTTSLRVSNPIGLFMLAACALPLMLTAASASDCPADKVGADGMKPGPMKPSGLTDTVIASIDLTPRGTGFNGYKMRIRKLVVEPGGIVPWHSHEARPANIYIISGAITEYRSTCSVPIKHKAGDVTSEFGALAHWWRNNTRRRTVLISADLLAPEMKPEESM